MSAVLDEFQFELDGRYVFGRGMPLFADKDGVSVGDAEAVTQDSRNTRNGARLVGRDVLGARTWTFGLHVDGSDPDSALGIQEEAAEAWFGTLERLDLGEVTFLRYCIGDRTRRVYGRPRRFSLASENSIVNGLLNPSATFDMSDHLFYDDLEESVELRLVAAADGGFTAPFEAPFEVTNPNADAASSEPVIVGGTAKTAPVVEFVGPVTNPEVQIGDMVIGIDGIVPLGETYTVDARPWANTVTRADGSSVGGALSSKTWLSRTRLKPGAYTATFRGLDESGAARCRVRWRKANYSL